MDTKGRLSGHCALITGGSRGIGLAIAREFVKEGASVLIASRSEETLAKARQELLALGGRVESYAADMSQAEASANAVGAAIAAFGRLDIVVSSAAEYTAKPFLKYTTEDLDRMLRLNLHGPFHLMQAALPHMAERGYGRIINIASTAGKWGSRNQSIYNMSKHGVVGLTRCAALEFAKQGVTINAICPGLVETDLVDAYMRDHCAINNTTPDALRADIYKRIPQGRFLQPEDCAHLAVYIASRESQSMTGQSLLIDGGTLMV
jgi:meso-butanediol dehydrogenase/(S,S)-butanediol dehydrogenase/diacetyl reductase